MSLLEILSSVLLVLGALVMLMGAAGLVRFPDLYTRLHPAGKGDTLGQALVLAGLALLAGFSLVSLKLVFIIVLVLLLNPTATHALARAGWVTGLQPWTKRPTADAPSAPAHDAHEEGGA